MNIALRVDVDTFRGTRHGVPALCRILSEFSIQATFFFSVGPDNMGRHLWRLARPDFFIKMLRSNAAGLYGWDILLRGTLWPGPVIGKSLKREIKDTAADGHEIGLHAWDHHAWQARIDTLSAEAVRRHLRRGVEALAEIVSPTCSAAPGWKCTDDVLTEKERFPFVYNSDCRGASIFRPVVGGKVLAQPQVPVSLPTYDEIIGRHGVTRETYNDLLLSRILPNQLNVLTIHAEAEGISCRTMFRAFIEKALAQGHNFTTLGKVLCAASSVPPGAIVRGQVEGRDGWVAMQAVSGG
ncbi:MAG: 4-deoxy-4-formamido-L-arabinose-phosphoundecaprenol deformylase [Verrucomicrobia bacterium]|nr:4-deoxy-4-formamido-L-arabinose-phosphoundecaprenol deformylase [Verrucomicrobiota bacterium]MCG2678980.1 4-deoxy-4-formamido-L-arabinose-phosphoundecaprenol deformylase [Kiritimatiellia bacterium]MBU4247636.1 4-deoxy-4-formamido-L-arabinose-phosphoundecaprenol deformylase [Verrucomicrobiota bacterium]MBU4290817.1 4-deoxy-4-formamido-L-arabinose-phosphoundecaprenol deformylase [Verrucomicrobiota bacterium]MBU4427868.1 4-deoxy-4-formamido-L-arabinose-phosphoundecaprenol deformylase [Verrucomi